MDTQWELHDPATDRPAGMATFRSEASALATRRSWIRRCRRGVRPDITMGYLTRLVPRQVR